MHSNRWIICAKTQWFLQAAIFEETEAAISAAKAKAEAAAEAEQAESEAAQKQVLREEEAVVVAEEAPTGKVAAEAKEEEEAAAAFRAKQAAEAEAAPKSMTRDPSSPPPPSQVFKSLGAGLARSNSTGQPSLVLLYHLQKHTAGVNCNINANFLNFSIENAERVENCP